MRETTFKKLTSGDWGILVKGSPAPKAGEVVSVRKASGQIVSATVEKVIWSDSANAICTIQSNVSKVSAPTAARKRTYGSGRCSECGDRGRLGTGCTGAKDLCYDCDS